MIKVEEVKEGRKSVFIKKVFDDDNNLTDEVKVECPLYRIESEEDHMTYFILYDDQMKRNQAVFDFLNIKQRGKPYNSRNKQAIALRLLYCYLSLFDYDIENLDTEEVSELILFLKGTDQPVSSKDAINTRSNQTINEYFATYRTFMRQEGFSSKGLFSTRTNAYLAQYMHDMGASSAVHYESNLKTSNPNEYNAPDYISIDDAVKLLKLTREYNDIQGEMLIRLMYTHGLRLGEALGLTLEDIVTTEVNNKTICGFILRNRISDKRFQSCKGLPHCKDPKEYKSTYYIESSDFVAVTDDFYDMLANYIEDAHSLYSEKYPENYAKSSADIVSSDYEGTTNTYIFLNQFGKILSDQTWNNRLKRYFDMLGIPRDYIYRMHNLNHRFRHGCAMYWHRDAAPDKLKSDDELRRILRHRSIHSVEVYKKPTMADELKDKEEFEEEFNSLLDSDFE